MCGAVDHLPGRVLQRDSSSGHMPIAQESVRDFLIDFRHSGGGFGT